MERRTDLQALIKKPTPQDVIVAIFAYSRLDTFTNDMKKIQTFIRENKTGKAAQLLEPFVFSEGVDIYPYSRLLASVLTGLRLGKIIFTWSPKDDSYNIEDETREKVIRQTKERFPSRDLAILRSLGRKWWHLNKPFSAIDVVMALLVFLPGEFPNNIEVIHRTIKRLREVERYQDLLMDFDDFIDYPRFSYSPLLDRTLNILKGVGGCINLLSPDYNVCIVRDASREILRRDVLNKYFSEEEQGKLEGIASELKSALGC